MKKILLIAIVAFLSSCTKTGEIQDHPKDFIVIHGKTYKLISVVPCDDCRSIWIMYPKDSLDKQPEVINYDIKSGKTTVNETVIKVY